MNLQTLFGRSRTLPKDWAGITIKGLTADSRLVEPGFVFAALPGTLADGAKFIPDALQRGAVAILADESLAGTDMGDAAFVPSSHPRHDLALAAARFYASQPEIIAAVTGTNGKTSVASFLRQIWECCGFRAANLGTTGIHGPNGHEPLGLTTPGPVQLHQSLHELAGSGVTHAAIEASSHGLEQRRLDGVRISAAAFTNISRDHLDYHKSFEDYLAQKLRLFRDLLPEGGRAVIASDGFGADEAEKAANERGLEVLTVGWKGRTLRLLDVSPAGFSQNLTLWAHNRQYKVTLPLAGEFQVENALVAAGLAMACGLGVDEVLPCLSNIKGARGRLEPVGQTGTGAQIFIDYAHTPDALETAMKTLRPYVKNRLIVMFGAGGDRDAGKRPQMGEVAARLADKVYVTDDNPRGEDPAKIRAQVIAACPGAAEIGPRGEAVAEAIAGLEAGDVLLLAGKGHETGQVVAGETLPFSDHDAAAAALAGQEYRP